MGRSTKRRGKRKTILLETTVSITPVFNYGYSSIGRSLSGLNFTPDSTPGRGATGPVSRNFPDVIHSFRVVAISTARE